MGPESRCDQSCGQSRTAPVHPRHGDVAECEWSYDDVARAQAGAAGTARERSRAFSITSTISSAEPA